MANTKQKKQPKDKIDIVATKMVSISKGLTYSEFKRAAWIAIDKASDLLKL